MILFIIKSALCMVLFLGVYYLFFEREKMPQFNRYYLMVSLLLSLVIPNLTIPYEFPQIAEPLFTNITESIATTELISPMTQEVIQTSTASQSLELTKSFDYSILIWIGYFIIALTFLLRFVWNLISIRKTIRTNDCVNHKGVKLILLDKDMVSYTFTNYVFLSKEEYYSGRVKDEVLTHEITHVREKHTLDIILLELVRIVLWFNPLLIIYRRAIKLNHEFIADGQVIEEHQNINNYQKLLINTASNNSEMLFSNFNFSVTKKRLNMMKLKKNKMKIIFNKIGFIPVVIFAIMLFSQKVISNNRVNSYDGLDSHENQNSQLEVSQFQKDTIIIRKASLDMMTEYNESINEFKRINKVIHSKNLRAKAIYNIMSSEQKASVKKLPKSSLINLEKKKRKNPSKKEFESWTDSDTYAIWIDRVNIENERLGNYNANDFDYYFVSFVYNNARSEKFPQPYQINLYTTSGFEKIFEKSNVNQYIDFAQKYIEEVNKNLRIENANDSEARILRELAKIYYELISEDLKKKYHVKDISSLYSNLNKK